MSLPQNWKGVFYSTETAGNEMFDLSPLEFIAFINENSTPEEQKISPIPFLLAGAYFDLFVHGFEEKASAVLLEGRRQWPEKPWDHMQEFTGVVHKDWDEVKDDSESQKIISRFVPFLFDVPILEILEVEVITID